MSSCTIIAIIDYVSDIPTPIQSGPWMLDPDITYLNHGSFGARTTHIFETQQSLKRSFEASPVDFLDRQGELLATARQIVADFVGADIGGFGFVENATTGVGCVIHSLKLQTGDEIVTTNHVYNGVRQLLHKHCTDHGLLYREIQIPLPIHSPDEMMQYIEEGLSEKTKVLVIDHITSATSIIVPIQKIIDCCKNKGILTLVDGAHAPGMLDLHIQSLAPDWYVGNLHKWVCAPLGAAFVWSSELQRTTTHPMTVSHWLNQGYVEEFNWQGTRDITAWLSAAAAIEHGNEIGWERIRTHNHQLVTWMHETLIHQWDVLPLSPIDGSMLGSMATVLLPRCAPQSFEECLELRDKIYAKYAIEVPIFEFQGQGMLRVSAQLYSGKNDVKHLIQAISNECIPN